MAWPVACSSEQWALRFNQKLQANRHSLLSSCSLTWSTSFDEWFHDSQKRTSAFLIAVPEMAFFRGRGKRCTAMINHFRAKHPEIFFDNSDSCETRIASGGGGTWNCWRLGPKWRWSFHCLPLRRLAGTTWRSLRGPLRVELLWALRLLGDCFMPTPLPPAVDWDGSPAVPRPGSSSLIGPRGVLSFSTPASGAWAAGLGAAERFREKESDPDNVVEEATSMMVGATSRNQAFWPGLPEYGDLSRPWLGKQKDVLRWQLRGLRFGLCFGLRFEASALTAHFLASAGGPQTIAFRFSYGRLNGKPQL